MKHHDGHGFMVTDSVGKIVYANDALCKLSKKSRVELIGVESDRLLTMRCGLEIDHSPIYGGAGEYLGGFAVVRLLD